MLLELLLQNVTGVDMMLMSGFSYFLGACTMIVAGVLR